MLKFLENHVKTQQDLFFFFFFFFFQIFKLGNIFEILTKKAKNVFFCQKNHLFTTFCQNFQKYCINQKYEKKTFPREMSYCDFQAIVAFLTQNYHFKLGTFF